MIKNIVGDVTGFAVSMKLLHAQMPTGELWGLGDLIDRGPDSKGVLDYFIDGGHKSVMGNHDHMMLWERLRHDKRVHSRLYPPGCWGYNGGNETIESFNREVDLFPTKLKKYFDYIETMPLRQEMGNLILTHAPVSDRKSKKIYNLALINKDRNLLDRSVLWNRSDPTKVPGKFQIYGHNSTRGILWHTDRYPQGIYMSDPLEVPEGAWAVCIDTWRETYLTGLSVDLNLLEYPQKAIKVFLQDLVEESPYISELKKANRAANKKLKGTI